MKELKHIPNARLRTETGFRRLLEINVCEKEGRKRVSEEFQCACLLRPRGVQYCLLGVMCYAPDESLRWKGKCSVQWRNTLEGLPMSAQKAHLRGGGHDVTYSVCFPYRRNNLLNFLQPCYSWRNFQRSGTQKWNEEW